MWPGLSVLSERCQILTRCAWSRALRGFLEQWLGSPAASACGIDDASQQRYRDTMTEAGLGVTETRYDCTDELDFDHLVGGVYSALPGRRGTTVRSWRDSYCELSGRVART